MVHVIRPVATKPSTNLAAHPLIVMRPATRGDMFCEEIRTDVALAMARTRDGGRASRSRGAHGRPSMRPRCLDGAGLRARAPLLDLRA